MSRFLITGGCGFIGSHLAEALLDAGHSVRIIDNLSTGKLENVPDDCEVIVGDITDTALVQNCMQYVDGVYHLAAVSSVQMSNEDWLGTHRTNLTGTINILDAARPGKTPVVYASSAAVYGDNADMPLTERCALRPLTAYGADKMGSELHARVASFVHGVPTTGMRFFNVFGERQDPASPYSGVISIFANRITSQQDITIYGDGEQTRDFIYVKDVVSHLIASMQSNNTAARILNVCTGKAVSIKQMAKSLMLITGNRVDINYSAPRAGDIRTSLGSPEQAHNQLGIRARADFIKSLQQLIRYMRQSTPEKTASDSDKALELRHLIPSHIALQNAN